MKDIQSMTGMKSVEVTNRNAAIALVAALVVFGAGYAAGTHTSPGGAPGGQFAGRTGAAMQGGYAGARTGGTRAGGMGAAFGSILSKDADSITLQLGGPDTAGTNGSNTGSRIVFINDRTQVGKFTTGSMNDLAPGTTVMVSGTPNSDGSITATQIQIRPAGQNGPGASAPRGAQQ